MTGTAALHFGQRTLRPARRSSTFKRALHDGQQIKTPMGHLGKGMRHSVPRALGNCKRAFSI
jgi:hypothetical protein